MSDSISPTPHSGAAHREARRRRIARRVRFAPSAVLAGVAASAVIALSMSGTLAGFAAQITNNDNSAASGVLTMTETQGATTCSSNASGSSIGTNAVVCGINKFTGSTSLVPGTPVTATVTMKNTGTVAANSFTLTPGSCLAVNLPLSGGAIDACSKMTLKITQDGNATPVASGTLAGLASNAISLPALASQASATFTFALTLPTLGNSTLDNAYQGVQISQNLVWQAAS